MTTPRWPFVLVLLVVVTASVAAQPLGTDVIASDWNGVVYRVPPTGPMTTIGTYARVMWSLTMDVGNQDLIAPISASGGYLARINLTSGLATTVAAVPTPFFAIVDQDGDYLVSTLGKDLLKVKRDGSAITTILSAMPNVPIPTRDKDSGDWILYSATNQLHRYTDDWSSVLATMTHSSIYVYEMVQDAQRPDVYLAAANLARYDPRTNKISVLSAVGPGILGDRGIVTDRAPGSNGAMIYLSSPALNSPTTLSSVIRLDRTGTVLGTVATLPAPVTGIVLDQSCNLGSQLMTFGNDRIIRVSFPTDAGKPFVVALGLSGFYPGVKLPDGRVIPLNLDPLVALTAGMSIPPAFTGNIGLLDAAGRATVTFNTNTLPVPPGMRIWAAGVTLDPAAPLGISQISAPLLFVL
jgi:hypothetical protein